MSAIEITAQPRIKEYQGRPQLFHNTTKQGRMQKYYDYIQPKDCGQTSLKDSSTPQYKSVIASPLPMSSGSVNGDMRGNISNVELMQMMSLPTPRYPIQRIENSRKAWQTPELRSDHTDATAVHHNVSKEHHHPFKNVPGATESSKYHKFSYVAKL